MKKEILLSLLLLGGGVQMANADITVKATPGAGVDRVVVKAMSISDLLSATRSNPPHVTTDSVALKDGVSVVPLSVAAPARYVIAYGERGQQVVYAVPGDNILVQITSPDNSTVEGTPLMDGISRIEQGVAPLNSEYEQLVAEGRANAETVGSLQSRFEQVMLDFLKQYPDSPAAPYAVMDLGGDKFVEAFKALTPAARKSILYPLAEKQNEMVQAQLAKEARQKAMTSGSVDAPAFTLNDLDGKPVSLADYKGKWVVLDFWGSWCIWCIKGFPALKEAYEKHKDRVVVIGIDNNDTPEKWKAAVAKYKLPWVNVYNPDSNDKGVAAAYGVQGYPTKVIVNPEGKIVDITTGEEPEFFKRLDDFLKAN